MNLLYQKALDLLTTLIKNHKIAGIEEVDKATVLAMRYMKRLVSQVISSKKSVGTESDIGVTSFEIN